VDPSSPNAEMQVNDIQAATRSVGGEVTILNASAIRDIDAAFARLVEMRADALLVVADPIFFNRTAQLVVLAARHAIPTLYSRREFTAAGGLMSYGPNINDSYRLLGVYAARILKGEKRFTLLKKVTNESVLLSWDIGSLGMSRRSLLA
jgi:putative tryptophan/tyrosine transport system substrate-binding protein